MDDTNAMVAENNMVGMLNKSEIDQQIATAHKYPRSIKRFRDETLQMVTLNENVAAECIYSLPRDGKTIEGASARFAEVVASAWGNSRAGARVIDDRGDFVTAQGVFHDLEKNVAITYEVQRRIVDKFGKRYKPDMITVTANAACSIALRNAILKGVPKAFWSDMYEAARKTVMGDFATLANRRANALAKFQAYGVTPEQIFATLDVQGVEDISLEHIATLVGIMTAIKDGDTTPEEAFGSAKKSDAAPAEKPVLSDEEFQKRLNSEWKPVIASGKKTPAQIITMIHSANKLTDAQMQAINATVPANKAEQKAEQEPAAEAAKSDVQDDFVADMTKAESENK